MDQSGSTGGVPASSGSGWTAQAPHPMVPAGGFNFNDYLKFRYLITPTFITIIYVIGAILITLAGLAGLAQGGAGVIGGLVIFAVGNLFWRIYMEFVMVLFRINDSLQSIDRRGKGM